MFVVFPRGRKEVKGEDGGSAGYLYPHQLMGPCQLASVADEEMVSIFGWVKWGGHQRFVVWMRMCRRLWC